MTPERDLREQLATSTRIFAMQGLIGLFGHVSVYQRDTKTIFITPGSGSDKPHFQETDMIPIHLDGTPLDGKTQPPVEWPIHTALHGARTDALAFWVSCAICQWPKVAIVTGPSRGRKS